MMLRNLESEDIPQPNREVETNATEEDNLDNTEENAWITSDSI